MLDTDRARGDDGAAGSAPAGGSTHAAGHGGSPAEVVDDAEVDLRRPPVEEHAADVRTDAGDRVDALDAAEHRARAAVRRLHEATLRMTAGQNLAQVLHDVVDGVCRGVGFGVAVVNLVVGQDEVETVAVAGPPEAREALLGRRQPLASYEAEFAIADEWGRLRFVPHERVDADSAAGWVPEPGAYAGPDAWHPLDALFAPLTDSAGRLVGVLGVDLPEDGRLPGPLQRDLLEIFAAHAGIAIEKAQLTDRLREERNRLAASEESFRLAFEGAGTPMTIVSLEPADAGRFLRVNNAFVALTGYTREELLTRTVLDITHPEDLADDVTALRPGIHGTPGMAGLAHAYQAEKRYTRADRSAVWVSVTTSPIGGADGGVTHAISQVEDITARRAEREQLTDAAFRDPLTGLANRAALTRHLHQSVAAAISTGASGRWQVLFCDLDGFKDVNDTLGHAAGDRLLCRIADRLQGAVRSHDLVARLGGDEFVVVLADVDAASAAEASARIRASVLDLATCPDVGGGPLCRVGVSIGQAELAVPVRDGAGAGPGELVDLLLASADERMYAEKRGKRDLAPGLPA